MNFLLVAIALFAAAPASASSALSAAELSIYTQCSPDWAGGWSNGSEEMVFKCSNGHEYYQRNALCSYVKKGRIFNSKKEDLIQLLCEVSRAKVDECLADNIKNEAEIEKCQTERDEDHAENIRNSHKPQNCAQDPNCPVFSRGR